MVVHFIDFAVHATDDGGITFRDLVDRFVDHTRAHPRRVEGLAGWLPVSRMAHWLPTNGKLWLHPSTDTADLCHRYAAWVHSQQVPRNSAKRLTQYARAVVEKAVEVRRSGPPRVPAGTDEAPTQPFSPTRLATPAKAETPLVSPIQNRRIRHLLEALDDAFLERGTHVRASLLALLSGQHVLLLGPPGTAKSMLARALCECFADAVYFEYLLSRFTHPDELFGPVSIPGLKHEDYRRLTEGFLPSAHVAFLDEIFKANSAILNSLLTLINERVFHHGRHRDPVPLLGLIGASNELPDPEGGLSALFDRFLVRLAVPPLSEAAAFLDVATGQVPTPTVPEDARLTSADREAILAAADEVVVPDDVSRALITLWRTATRSEWGVSDRRWRQAVQMLKVAAATDERRVLGMLDLFMLVPILAPSPDTIAEVRDAILEHISPGSVPEHDLRAQWLLLRADLVAPTVEDPRPTIASSTAAWPERLASRRRALKRFFQLHHTAVERLAADRHHMEQLGESHLWLGDIPVEMLSAHIEASRDLANILTAAERYRNSIDGPLDLSHTLVDSLPEPTQRQYGQTTAVVLTISDANIQVGLTRAGERLRPWRAVVPERARAYSTSTTPASNQDPMVLLTANEFLDWVDGRQSTEELLAKVPAWSGRDVAASLDAVRKHLGGNPIPDPPDLPDP